MFGVVPKPLWERRIPADDRNRIPLALRCLLIEAPDALVLVDTGAGDKESDQFRNIYGLENEGDPTRLEDAIRAAGFAPDDVDIVLNTHLHFDHAGGNTRRNPGSDEAIPSFPSARYVVQRGELDFAATENERIRASYLTRNIEPVQKAGLWHVIEGDTEVTRGIRVIPSPGHTPFHQCVLIHSDGAGALFLADVCPTRAHVPLPWIMGYDLDPLVSLETKRTLWKRSEEEEWLLILQHDAEVPWGHLSTAGGRPELVPFEGATNR
jgi:glyoxylase-like metal-dependent hydrolase (beta-lactamase superfamily II)